MTWVKIDDQFFRNRKVRAVGKDGRELYLAALCWSSSELTDGFIPDYVLGPLAAEAEVRGPSTARALVAAGLWEQVEGGWQVPDYLDYQPSGAKIREQRAYEREKKRRQRRSDDGRYTESPRSSRPPSPPMSRRDNNGTDTGSPRHGPGPVPSVPSPSPLTTSSSSTHAGTRPGCDDDEEPPHHQALWATLALRDLDRREHDKGTVANPERWLATAANRRRDRHHDLVHQHPHLDLDQLLDLCDPPPDEQHPGPARPPDADTTRRNIDADNAAWDAERAWCDEADTRISKLTDTERSALEQQAEQTLDDVHPRLRDRARHSAMRQIVMGNPGPDAA